MSFGSQPTPTAVAASTKGPATHFGTLEVTMAAASRHANRERSGREPVVRSRLDRVKLHIAVSATLYAIVAWIIELRRIDVNDVSSIGFIGALGPAFFTSAAFLVAAFMITLSLERLPRWLIVVQVVVLVLLLYGTVVISEPLPRFATAWYHAGFTDYIARTGSTIPSFDARFNWPGFFSVTAMLSRALGLDSPVPLLRAAPIVFNLLGAIGVFSIASIATLSERTRWIATWIFLSTNWFGQDYFAPQAMAYVLALAYFAILLRWFRTRPPVEAAMTVPRTRLQRLLAFAPDEVVYEPTTGAEQARLVAVAISIFAVIVVTHQLTPPIIIASTTLLVLAKRCRLQTLPFVLVGVFLAWLSFGAIGYWSGHIHELFGGLGRLGSSVQQNLVNRVSGNRDRLWVQRLRLALTALVFLLAVAGFARRVARRRGELTLALLAVAPFSVMLAQSYGGEALIRAVYFSLPYLAIFAAFAFAPSSSRPTWPATCLLFVVLIGLIPAFVVARYGNEQWDRVTPAEHAAFEYVYSVAPAGSTFVGIVSEVPWGYRSLETYTLAPIGERAFLDDPDHADQVMSDAPGDAYLVVTRGQIAFGRLFGGLPANWAADLVSGLMATGRYQRVFENTDSVVLQRTARVPE